MDQIPRKDTKYMSYSIVKKMEIVDGKIFATSVSNNEYPRIFERYEVPRLSELYAERGLKGLLAWMAVTHRDGGCKYTGSDKLSQAVKNAYRKLPDNLKTFLDDQRLGQFVAEYGETRLQGKRFGLKKALEELDALRSNEDVVLEICKERPEAFHCAAEFLQKERSVVEKYIEQCADMLFFEMPDYYQDDRELIMQALRKNGCIYRQISEQMRRDKEITLLAFDDSLERRCVEHLPDLIPEDLRKDQEFVKKLLDVGPCIHVSRTPELVADREAALIWIKRGKYVLADLYILKKEFFRDEEIQKILLERFSEPQKRIVLQQRFQTAGETLRPELAA